MVRKATLDLEVSVSSIQAIRLFRELAEEAGWALERHEGSRLVDRFAIIMPMAQSARTLGLKVLSGPMQGMELTCWSETRGSSGAVNIASWLVPGGNDEPLFRRFAAALGVKNGPLSLALDVWGALQSGVPLARLAPGSAPIFRSRFQHQKIGLARQHRDRLGDG